MAHNDFDLGTAGYALFPDLRPLFSAVPELDDRLKALFITHGHEDHIGAVLQLDQVVSRRQFSSFFGNQVGVAVCTISKVFTSRRKCRASPKRSAFYPRGLGIGGVGPAPGVRDSVGARNAPRQGQSPPRSNKIYT